MVDDVKGMHSGAPRASAISIADARSVGLEVAISSVVASSTGSCFEDVREDQQEGRKRLKGHLKEDSIKL